jgi:radical SAM protein with 4Fe4S-binding SPASM domain
MEISDFGKLTDILSAEGIEELDVLGGEPTLHSDLIRMIAMSLEKGLRISMSTNGSDAATLRYLSENFSRSELAIGISLNDKVPVDDLSNYIHEHKPLLKSVCSKERFMPETMEEFIDIPGIRYYAIFMDALHKADLGNCLSFPQYYGKLQSIKGSRNNVEGVFCSCFMQDIGNNPDLEGMRCPAGTTKLSVMPDGSVYPCYLFFSRPEFRLGNILRDKFDAILSNPVLSYFRRFSGNSCLDSDCEFFRLCRGGCPAVSLMICGDMNSPDPRCSKS